MIRNEPTSQAASADADVDRDVEVEPRGVARADAVVDRVAHEQPAADLHGRGERRGEREQRDAAALIARRRAKGG